jgi:biopolymer transport protein ExbD
MASGLSPAMRLQLPERRRNYRFALTPLADAMFQLLIFFMLSSSLTPYSLLTVQSAADTGDSVASQGGNSTAETTPPALVPGETVVWAIDKDAVVVAGQRIGFDSLGDLVDALGTAERPADVVLVIQTTARVQDVTTVLARLSMATVGTVRISTEGN